MSFVRISATLGLHLACPDFQSGSAGTARGHTHTEAAQPAASAPFTLNPCAMSRGRGGLSREHYHRHPPPFLGKNNHYRSGPSSSYPRAGPPLSSYPNYYEGNVHPVLPIPPPAPLSTSAPPAPSHIKAALNSSHNQNHSPGPAPNSFQYQQVQFLRGQSSEAPQFRAAVRGGGGAVVTGRPPGFSTQSGYRFPNPNSSLKGRGSYSQDQSFARPPGLGPPQGTPGPRHLNQNQLQSKNHSQYSSRQWGIQTDSLCDKFQTLSFQDRPSRRGDRFDRHYTSNKSGNLSFSKGSITLNPDIQDQVHKALAALRPSECISAKSLAKKLRLPKKIVNKALYALERSQKASKQGLKPPEWTLYRESLRGEENQNSAVQSPPAQLCVTSEVKVELKTETAENSGQEREEDDSSSSYCSSSESSDSEDSQSPATGQHQEKQHPSTTNSPDQELQLPTMTDQKEQILRYLLDSGEANALIIAKNVGLRSAKQVNPTLYALEKQGEVVKNAEVNPPTWELSNHRREMMERSLKASQSTPAEGSQIGVATRDEKGGGSMFLPSPPLPPVPGLEPLPFEESWMPEQSHSEKVGFFFF